MPFRALNIKSGYRNEAPFDATFYPYKAKYHTDYETTGTTTLIPSGHPTENFLRYGLPLGDSLWADSLYANLLHAANGGTVMGAFEHMLYSKVYLLQNLVFGRNHPKLAANFFYIKEMYLGKNNLGYPYVNLFKIRPQSGEEVRLEIGAALAFGAKGLMYDKFFDLPDSVYPNVWELSTPDTTLFIPGLVTNRTSTDWDVASGITPDNVLSLNELGSDFIEPNHPWKITQCRNLADYAADMELGDAYPQPDSMRVYYGQKSMRIEVKKWHDLIRNPATSELIWKMWPVAWIGTGYKRLTGGNMEELERWIDTSRSAVRMWKWTKAHTSDTSWSLVEEPDSLRLYDFVLLDTRDSVGPVTDSCILAVINRRTDPHVIDGAYADSIRVYTTYEFDSLVVGDAAWTYRQLGARRIRIPFNFTQYQGKSILMEIHEITLDSTRRIDTVIAGTTDLDVSFKPGETRFFRIIRRPAADTAADGFLAFNTQNKLVAYPVPRYAGTGYTDSIRYHMVYHRKDPDPIRTGVWTVFYKRSKPYLRDNMPNVAGLEWQEPIRLSRYTYLSRPRTNNTDSTQLFPGVEPMFSDSTIDTVDFKDLSCGFPSIVVREDSAGHPRVHVVYACHDLWSENFAEFMHIVENTFADVASLNPAQIEAGGKSLVVSRKGDAHDADSLTDLALWGTPVVNACANNRLYYAWNSLDQGLGVGVKAAGNSYFPTNAAIMALPRPTIGTKTGGQPYHPTLNVYSNIARNHEHASVAWEENAQIRYTRLRSDLSPLTIENYLPDIVGMRYSLPTAPPIPLVGSPDYIAIMSDTTTLAVNALPVLTRSLIPDSLVVTILDTTAGLDGSYEYQHESLAWQQYLTGPQRSQIRHRQFFDMPTVSPNGQLHYWYTGTTFSAAASLFHPAITQGVVRLDSLTWEGVVGSTLFTYNQYMHINNGNLSDSAIVLNYNVLTTSHYNELKIAADNNQGGYWQGAVRFSNLLTQQMMLRPFPGIPAPPSPPTIHTEYLKEGGAWPHLAARQREDWPAGLQSVRRVLQSTTATNPTLLNSAEGFYRLTTETDSDTSTDEESVFDPDAKPQVLAGFETSHGSACVTAVLDDGSQLQLYPDPDSLSPLTAFGPHSLVSDPFSIGALRTMQILVAGTRREGVHLSIERFETALQPDPVALTMPSARMAREGLNDVCTTYLTEGGGHQYRLRLHYSGSDGYTYQEMIDISPSATSFQRVSPNEPFMLVNLSKGTLHTTSPSSAMSALPNVTSDVVHLLFTSGSNQKTDRLTIAAIDALGVRHVLFHDRYQSSIVMSVQHLVHGRYHVVAYWDDGSLCGQTPVTILR